MTSIGTSAGGRMDRIYRYQRHFYDATRKYFLLGRDRLLRDLEVPPGGSVLEIGCGTGRNLILAARRYPDAKFFGLDISSAMLQSAEASVHRARLEGQITLREADATSFQAQPLFGVAVFDRIFISYALSMIPEWRKVLRCAGGALAPGGGLHVVDFGQHEGLPSSFRRALYAWIAIFHVTPRPDLEQALGDIANEKGLRLSFTRLYRGYADYAVLCCE